MYKGVVVFGYVMVQMGWGVDVAMAQAGEKPVGVIATAQVSKGRPSINTLKEDVGYAARDFFDALNTAHRHMGLCGQRAQPDACKQLSGMQVQVADMYKKISQVLSALLDGKQPFKKAKRPQLQACYQMLQRGRAQLLELTARLDGAKQADTACIRSAVTSLAAVHAALTSDSLVSQS